MKAKVLTGLAIIGGAMALAMPAHAAQCTTDQVGLHVTFFNCQSDNQGDNADDMSMFIDKKTAGVSSTYGSLGKNDDTFKNILAQASDGQGSAGTAQNFSNVGSGYATLKSDGAGSPTNALLQFEFTNPGLSNTLPTKGNPSYAGFDGMLFRGQIDATNAVVTCVKKKCTTSYTFNGDVHVLIDYTNGESESYTFTGVPDTKDFGVLGFDEWGAQQGYLIKDVFIYLDSGQGAWNQMKQIDFSVVGSAVPEPATWAMMFLGFAGLGFAAFRRSAKPRLENAIA